MKGEKKSDSFSWKCDVCSIVVNHKKSVSCHKKTHLEVVEKCFKEFRKDNFVRHQAGCHKKPAPIDKKRCKICLKTFEWPYLLKCHWPTHSEKKAVECKNCCDNIPQKDIEQHSITCLSEDENIVSMVELPNRLTASDSNVTEFEEQVVPCCSTSSVNNTEIYEAIQQEEHFNDTINVFSTPGESSDNFQDLFDAFDLYDIGMVISNSLPNDKSSVHQ